MVAFAEGAILIGQTLLLVLLLLIIYVSIRNGRKVAERQLDILEAAIASKPGDSATMGRLIDGVTGVHEGMASRTRLLLALGIFGIAAMMALSIAFGDVPAGQVEVLGQGVTLLFGLLATIVGFYFGGRSAMHASHAVKDLAPATVVVDEAGSVVASATSGDLKRVLKDVKDRVGS